MEGAMKIQSIGLVLMGLVGCATQKEAPPPVPVAATVSEVHQACAHDHDCNGGLLCVEGECVPATATLCRDANVHFDYDSATLKPNDVDVLERVARCAQAMPDMAMLIEGNADERGTTEYNLALGERRALSVDRILRYLGVAERQLRPVSYGKERPLCEEHNEGCWEKNRRAEIARTASR
jgi:peptidoglycan-associated lipoprotein